MSDIMKCKNCQHRREDKRYYTCQHENDKYYCTVFSMYVNPNDFCSYYAERKEEVGDPTMSDSINRQAVIDMIMGQPPEAHYPSWYAEQIKALPSAQPERLTDDDFETIRIHLNAYKEKLCNQRRWEEAEEYQRIIDRFLAFASAQPERAIKDCRNCKHGNYNDHWGTYFCYYSGDCNDWGKWEPSAEPDPEWRKKHYEMAYNQGYVDACKYYENLPERKTGSEKK